MLRFSSRIQVKSKLYLAGVIIFVCMHISACGSSDFMATPNTNSKKDEAAAVDKASDDNKQDKSQDATKGQALVWNWPCDPQALTAKAGQSIQLDNKKNATLLGAGEYIADPVAQTYDLAFVGEICPGAQLNRDVVFLLDGSSSMSFNDPYKAGSCGRLETIKAVMGEMLKRGPARFGILQFSRADKDLIISSNGFYNDYQSLLAAISANQNGKNPAELICDSNHLGTNYDVAFAALVKNLLPYKQPDSNTEIFMVSDGKPLFGQTGDNTADQLKSQGVTIGTIAVQGREDVLRDKLASVDSQGQPLFSSVKSAKDLTQAILALADRMPIGASLLYRAIGASTWNAAALIVSSSDSDDRHFTSPIISFNRQDYPDGLEVTYTSEGTPAIKPPVAAQLSWK